MAEENSLDRSQESAGRSILKELVDLDIAAVCWLTHEVRTASYARYLGATLYNIHYLSNRHPFYAPFKYIPQCLKTWSVLLQQKPDVIYVMNPPVFAALSVYIYCLLRGTPFVMDTHTPSLYGRRWGWSVPLQRALAKKAIINIIDQERFRLLFEEWDARSVVLERPPLDVSTLGLNPHGMAPLGEIKSGDDRPVPKEDALPFHVAVIGTFSSDEPFGVVVSAAVELPDVTFSILGDVAKAPRHLVQSSPANVYYPGYLMGSAYWQHLHAADAIMVLTTFPYSLLGGAQEGMALGKPLILSHQPALVDYFSQGAVFVEHTTEGISAGVLAVKMQNAQLSRESASLAVQKRQRWHEAFQVLASTLAGSVKS